MLVYLIDGTYESSRQYFGRPSSAARDGTEIGATRGVLWSVASLLSQGVTHLGVATDHVIESFRNDLWPTYKTGRVSTRAQGAVPAGWRRRSRRSACGSGRWPSSRPTTPWPRPRPWPCVTTASSRSSSARPTRTWPSASRRPVIQFDRRASSRDSEEVPSGRITGSARLHPRLARPGGRQRRRVPRPFRLGGRSASVVLARYGRIEDIPHEVADWDPEVTRPCEAPRASLPDWLPSGNQRCCSRSLPRSGSIGRCSACRRAALAGPHPGFEDICRYLRRRVPGRAAWPPSASLKTLLAARRRRPGPAPRARLTSSCS